MKRKDRAWVRVLICFLALFALAWFFPYSGDDWAWGSRIGTERLHSWFEMYNGRYVGNLFVLVMTRSNLAKALIMSVCLTGILVCIEKIGGGKWAFYLGGLFLILTPKLVFRQAVVWTAGFSNYAVSAFLTLIYVAYVYPLLEKGEMTRRIWHCAPLFVLGAAGSLIMEPVTIYNVVLGAGVIVYCCIVYRKAAAQHVAYLAGALSGAVYMFSNSAYHVIAEQGDDYRSMAGDGVLATMKENFLNVIYEEFFLNNVWLNIAMAAACVLLYRQVEKKSRMVQICLGYYILYCVFAVFSSFGIQTGAKTEGFMYAEGAATALAVLSLAAFALWFGRQKYCLWKMFFWTGSIFCLTAPLLVVTPIGSRCFFITYVMFIGFLAELCRHLPGRVRAWMGGRAFASACTAVAGVGLLFYLSIFTSVRQAERDRLAHIQKELEQGKREIEILHLPYESYIWVPTPTEEPWGERYKLFYGIPEDVQLKAVWEYTEP